MAQMIPTLFYFYSMMFPYPIQNIRTDRFKNQIRNYWYILACVYGV